MRALTIGVLLTFFWSHSVCAQQEGTNLQIFTPSALLPHQQFEMKVFNNIYSQTSYRDENKQEVDLEERQTFLTSQWQFTYGNSKSVRWNIGFDLYIQSARYDSTTSISPLKVFDKEGVSYARTALAFIGPRVKFLPFKNISRLSLQSAFLIPVERNLEEPRFLAHDGSTWWTQLFYDLNYKKVQFFFEGSLLYRFKENSDEIGFLRAPISIFINYFPDSKFTIYGMIQHSPLIKRLPEGSQTTFARTGHFTQAGIGLKYQLIPDLTVEVAYTNFFESRNDGAGSTYNLGFRFIQ